MATNTTNYGWTKPDYEDAADIMVINGTIDNIDAQVKTVETALDDKADKSTTYTKTEVDTALDSKADTSDIPTVPITAIQKNGAGITPVSGTVNITVPTTAADVSALPNTTKYAAALSLTINSSTFVMTGQLKDQNGDNLGTAQTIDLPLESVVVGGSYNSQTKKVVLTLQNGNTIEFSVADLVAGLQTELSTSNKLNPAFIKYDSTHRAVSDTEKSAWNSKQNALSSAQLAAVNSGIDSEKVAQIETNKNNISTDEAALVELVDGGAKNLYQFAWGSTTTHGGITFTNNLDGSWTLNGTSTFDSAHVDTYNATIEPIGKPGDKLVCALEEYISGIQIYIRFYNASGSQINPATYIINEAKEIVIPSNAVKILYRIDVLSTGTKLENVIVKPMICTKAAWDISHEYQPYRPIYQELYDKVQAKITKSQVYNRGTAISTGDDLNDYTSFGRFHAATGAIATSLINCPITTGFVMTVEESFQAGKMQTLVTIESGGDATVTYRRSQIYRSNTWSWLPWYKFEGTAVT